MSNRKAPAPPPKHRDRRRFPPNRETVWLFGLHAVRQALQNPARRHRRLLVTKNAHDQLQEVLSTLGEGTPAIEIVEPAAVSRLLPDGAVHQGCALECSVLPVPGLEEILENLPKNGILVILDQVTDPHNVGAILRSCAAFGASALVVQQRHSPPETGALAKAASGALDLIPLVRLPNLARGLDAMQEAGVPVVGLDDAAQDTVSHALDTLFGSGRGPAPVAIALGAEGMGLRMLTRKKCSWLVTLPTFPAMPSLNVSNAAAVALFAIREAQGARPSPS